MIKNVIIHGDSRDYIPRIKTPINCVITDPPFGVDYQSNSAVLPKSRQVNRKIQDDADPEYAIRVFHSIMGNIIPKLADEADIYVFTSWTVVDLWIPAVRQLNRLGPDGCLWEKLNHGIELKMMLIWDKGEPGQGDIDGNWGCGHELILFAKKGRRKMPFRRSGVLHCNKVPAGQNWHPTQKPHQLIEILVAASTNPGDLVVDPYSGSGSTSIACKNLGRNSLAFDIDKEYVRKSEEALSQNGLGLY